MPFPQCRSDVMDHQLPLSLTLSGCCSSSSRCYLPTRIAVLPLARLLWIFPCIFFGAHFALQTYSVAALLVFLCCCCCFSGCNLVNFPNTNITFYVSHPQTQILGWISSLLVNCSFVVFSYVVHALVMVSLLELTHHILYFHFYCADKQQQKISIKMLRQGNKT